jgi:hypothetical protein
VKNLSTSLPWTAPPPNWSPWARDAFIAVWSRCREAVAVFVPSLSCRVSNRIPEWRSRAWHISSPSFLVSQRISRLFKEWGRRPEEVVWVREKVHTAAIFLN